MKKKIKKPVEPVEVHVNFGQAEKSESIKIDIDDIAKLERNRLNPATKRYTVDIENEIGGSIVSIRNIRAQSKFEAIEHVKRNLVFTARTAGSY